ncbi:tRNA (adenosine(37)-N6)-threonylcarbamoyltransferase complex dimerization subunit type 1 TsaB [bacterium]|nr:tRNA (adenosine(37)-N6)-threonylcarbamoyltransferase complex dimerization subunit type 1 TsaB [bacterium]
MIILGIETTSEIGSAAIVQDGKLLWELVLEQPLRHSRYVIPAIDKMLRETKLKLTDMDKIAVGVGPGSFTGIRVGIAIAKGLSCDGSILLCGVPSMENMAAKMESEKKVCVAVYAQKNKFFVQCFLRKIQYECEPLGKCRIMNIDEIYRECGQKTVILSPDVKKINSIANHVNSVKEIYPSAYCAAMIAHNKPEKELSLKPVYIRRSEAEEKGAKVYKF